MPSPQRVLITGSSTGFGRLAALRLAARGHCVVATMRETSTRNAEAAERLVADAEGLTGALEIRELDVTDDASVTRAVADIEDAHGGLDVAVNNAGIAPMGRFEGFTPEQLLQAFDTNVVGVQRVNRAVLPGMRARRHGLLIHLGSTMGRIVWPFAGPYTATKYAIEGMVESLHYELLGTGVDVSILQPGAFATELLAKMMGPAEPERIESYGELASRPDRFWGPVLEALQKTPPDPGMVADAIVELVETPQGKRPLRRVVDALGVGPAVEDINQHTASVQERLLEEAGAKEIFGDA